MSISYLTELNYFNKEFSDYEDHEFNSLVPVDNFCNINTIYWINFSNRNIGWIFILKLVSNLGTLFLMEFHLILLFLIYAGYFSTFIFVGVFSSVKKANTSSMPPNIQNNF